jgi:ATP-dependent Clp protease ATP-binding subunit ClpA
MFERFTREARSAVVAAQQVARETDGRRVDSRHLLVATVETSPLVRTALTAAGLAPESLTAAARAELGAGSLDGEALASLGIDLEAVRREADASFGPGALDRAGRRSHKHIPFAPDAKKALELTLREALRLGQRSIRSEHLVLGILRSDSPGRSVLLTRGVDGDVLRLALEQRSRAA